MAVYISKKSGRLRFFTSLLFASGAAVLFCFLSAGPKLGSFYDFLLKKRPSPPVSGELLLIDTSLPGEERGDDILDPKAAASLLYTAAELGARTLIIQVPILGLSSREAADEEEILSRFDEEFSILGSNIRNLFDAIRTGSVSPVNAEKYVSELVELSDEGKKRLVSVLLRRDEEGLESMERAAAFFGSARRPADLKLQVIGNGGSGRSGVLSEREEYSRARPDPDGVIRRVAPVLKPLAATEEPASVPPGQNSVQEHIIYGALKARYSSSEIESPDSASALYGSFLRLHNNSGGGTIIPLDSNGAIIFETPHNGEDFRRIGISDFLAYDEGDRDLRRLLSEGEALGIFGGIEGENQPAILYDYALSLREEFISSPYSENGQKKLIWAEARESYFQSLEDFLYGPTEMDLVGNFEEIMAFESWESKPLGEEEIAKMSAMRDSLIQTFVNLREKYNEVLELRKNLKNALDASFCVLGKAGSASRETPEDSLPSQNFFQLMKNLLRPAFSAYNPTDAEVSIILANAIMTGRAIKPAGAFSLLLASLLTAALICLLIKRLGPLFSLGTGVCFIILTGTGFSLSFIFSGFWIDPLVPAAAGMTGVFVSFIWALFSKRRYSRRFRQAFGPHVSRACLKSLVAAGKPLPSQTATVTAAIVAIKNTAPSARGDTSDPKANAQGLLSFQEKVSGLIKKAGGTITGTEGDMVFACFGSPLERIFLRNNKQPSPYDDNIMGKTAPTLRAVEFVSETAKNPDCASWQFGLDFGNCAFAWTAFSGYFAFGLPVHRARILARLSGICKARAAISISINEALPDLAAKKLGIIKDESEKKGEAFYNLEIQ